MKIGSFISVCTVWIALCATSDAQTLQALIDEALRHAPSIKTSDARLGMAQARKKQASAERFGTIALTGGYTHYNMPRTLAPLTPASIMNDPYAAATTKDLLSTGIVYHVPLFTGFAQTQEVEMEALAHEAAKSRRFLTKSQLIFNLSSLYATALSLQENAYAQRQYVHALESLMKTVRKEVVLGKKARLDLLKIEKSLYAAKAALEAIEGRIETTKAAMAATAGIERVGKLSPLSVTIEKIDVSVEETMRRAKGLHRIKASEIEVKKAKKAVRKAKAQYYPQVAFDAYWGHNYGRNDASNPRLDGTWNDEELWQAGVSVTWNLFDFGAREARTQQARLSELQAQAAYERTLLEFKKALIDAKSALETAYFAYRSAQKEYALAKEAEKIERIRYENGASDINDLLYAKAQKRIAAAKRIERKYDYAKARFYWNYLVEKGSGK